MGIGFEGLPENYDYKLICKIIEFLSNEYGSILIPEIDFSPEGELFDSIITLKRFLGVTDY